MESFTKNEFEKYKKDYFVFTMGIISNKNRCNKCADLAKKQS